MAQKQRFKVGDQITYKDKSKLPEGKYQYGGENQAGKSGRIKSYDYYLETKQCYKIYVTAFRRGEPATFGMLESEFEEWDQPRELSKEELLAKAIQEYPIGTIYRCIFSDGTVEISSTSTMTRKADWLEDKIEGGSGYIYAFGKWAEIIARPKPDEPAEEPEGNGFKKGDYIVVLSATCYSHSINFIYKQREDWKYLRAELDDKHSSNNGDLGIEAKGSNWRYATADEIAAYDKAGKPIDVTTIKPEEQNLVGKMVKILGTRSAVWIDKGSTYLVTAQNPGELQMRGTRDDSLWWAYLPGDIQVLEYAVAEGSPEVKPDSYIDCETREQWEFAKKFYKEVVPHAIYNQYNKYLSIDRPGNTHTLDSLVKKGTVIPFKQWLDQVGQTANWEEQQDRMQMIKEYPIVDPTPEELLKRAKRDYPIGTKYKALNDKGNLSIYEVQNVKYEARWVVEGAYIEVGAGYVYASGNWAEIVETEPAKSDPQPMPSSKYEIGDVVDTNTDGYQYTQMDKYHTYDWETIAVRCDLKTLEYKALRILNKQYSQVQDKWWYELDGRFSNWYSECGIAGKTASIDEPVAPPKLDMEALLKEAKRRYPVGTKVDCLFHYTGKDTETGIIAGQHFADQSQIWTSGSKYKLCLYRNGKWAEIISKPEAKEPAKTPYTGDFKNCKISVPTPAINEQVQKDLFKLGVKWFSGKEVKYLSCKYLFIRSGTITKDERNEAYFKRDDRLEATPEELRAYVARNYDRPIPIGVGMIEQIVRYPATPEEAYFQEKRKGYATITPEEPSTPKNPLHKEFDIKPLQLTTSINKPKRRKVTL